MFSRTFTTTRRPLLGKAPYAVPTATVLPMVRQALPKQQMRNQYRLVGPGPQYRRFRRQQSVVDLWGDQTARRLAVAAVIGAGGIYVYNLEEVPVSGRRRFNIVSPEKEAELGKYHETIQQFKPIMLSSIHPTTRYVRRVMKRLIKVSGLEDLNWEVFVVRDDSIKNAFVIPGGKVFVFTGILEICRDEDSLAAVMAHEIAHTVAHHASERMSQSLIAVIALMAAILTIGDVGRLGDVLMQLMYLKPGSRKQEAEADYIGLMLMAQACYDPAKAVNFWLEMEKLQQFQPPQFLSTHPSHETRVKNIQQWLPEAQQKLIESDCGKTLDYVDEFKKAFHYSSW
ncbi:metalloendopeptidase [Rhizina undulata]